MISGCQLGPVIEQCLQWALESDQAHGVWGGLTTMFAVASVFRIGLPLLSMVVGVAGHDAPMDTEAFWRLIDDSRDAAGDVNEQADVLTNSLAQLSPEQIVVFDRVYREHKVRSYSWTLWAAGYIINGGCSDDGFEYFRDWLIAQGRDVFERALTDPDSLADLDLDLDGEQYAEAEDLGGAATIAYNRVTGTDIAHDWVALPDRPHGEPWEDEELAGLLPRLSARF
jgi:uncharacterized protein DUF4240/transcription factor WhiB